MMSVETFILFIFLLFLIAYFIHERLELFQLFTRLGIPGPPPNFFVGNMMDLSGNKKLVTEVMAEWEDKYGPFYGYFRGTRATLVVRDAEAVKDILVRNSGDFINRPHMIINVPPIADTVVGLRGQRWKKVRQTLSPVFSGAKVKQMFPIMSNCVKTTVDILCEKENSDERTVDAHKLFQGLACEVISVCALAMKVNSQRNPQDRFLVAVKGFLENAMGPFVKTALCIPLLAKIMGWGLEKFGYSHEMTKMIMESVRTAMNARRENSKQMQLSNGNGVEKWGLPAVDALQLMMDATGESGDSALSDEEIVANAWVFILGGFETTSAALSYTCYLLSMHQDVQEKLFQELKNELGIDEIPTYEKLRELTYLDQVICESLRLYPPVISFVVRGLEKDSQIGAYFVPKSIGIQIPIWQIHHDPNIWSEPYQFKPERFNNNAKKTYANNAQWIPFGAGPRSCLGARFAQQNIKFTLASILRKFKVIPASTGPYTLKLKVPSVTIVPDGGVPLRFISRNG